MVRSIVVLSLLAGWQARAAQPDLQAFAGNWKENLTRSHKVPSSTDVLSYTRTPDGSWTQRRFSGPATLRTTFRIDGKEYMPEGMAGVAVTWKEVSPGAWDTSTKLEGDVVSTSHREISSDGKRMTIKATDAAKNQAGGHDVTTAVYERTSGAGQVLEGSWKAISQESNSPDTMQIEIAANGEFKVRFEHESTFAGKLDGNEYPYTGPRLVPNLTVELQPVEARAIRVTYLRNHKPIYEDQWTLSSDGKVITTAGKAPGSQDQPSTSVYEKQ